MMDSVSRNRGDFPEGFGLHPVGHREQTDHGSLKARQTVRVQWPGGPCDDLDITCHK
jgi:hypothetical protein